MAKENKSSETNLTREQVLIDLLDQNFQKSDDEKKEFGEVVKRAEKKGVVFKKGKKNG